MSNVETDQLNEEIRRAEAKLRLASQLQRDARYLNTERRKIMRKMKLLEVMKNEREEIEEKLATCDGLLRELNAGKTEMQKALKESGNLLEKNRTLLDKTTCLKTEMESLEEANGDNFLDMLDNGVILCQLAKVIRERAQHAVYNGLHKGPVPELNGRCFENAARRSFFSRDNMENFIKFCRHLGVHQNLLFESDDLVLQNQPRNVVLCLLELSRITTKFNMEPPGLVQLEKEIAEEEQRSGVLHDIGHSSLLSWQFRPSASSVHNSLANRKRPVRVSSVKCRRSAKNPQLPRFRRSTSEGSSIEADSGHCQPVGGSDGIPSDHTEDDWSRGSSEDPDSEVDSGQNVRGDHRNEISELDRKVAQATKIAQKHCHCDNEKCSKLAVKKVGDGKYNIAGRNVFVRLLKGRHMMVRVGGGWDTLEHFLLRHDPCQKFISIRQKKTQNLSKRLYYLEYQPKKKYWSRH